MLTSQMTSICSSSRSSLSPFMVKTTVAAMHHRPQLSSLPRALSSRQQTRNFGFGIWAGILRPHKERRRALKQKLGGDAMMSRKPRNYQHLMQDYLEWKSCGSDTTGFSRRWVNISALRLEKDRLSKELSKLKKNEPGTGETLDRPPTFIWGKRWNSTTARLRSAGFEFRNGKGKPDAKPSEEHAKLNTHTEEYEYDPVSNRMVPKKSSSLNEAAQDFLQKAPNSTFKGYRSQFADFKPPSLEHADGAIHLDGAPAKSKLAAGKLFKYKELDRKQAASSTEPVIDPEFPPQKGELDAYKPFKYNEPDGKSPAEIAAAAMNTPSKEELRKYTPFWHNEPDGHEPEKKDPVSESLKDYESKPTKAQSKLPVNDSETSYIGTATHPESKDLLSKLFELPNGESKPFLDPQFPDDAHKYNSPYMYNEPDGQKSDSAAFGFYPADFPEDTYKYQGPFKYNEPDGHPPKKIDPVAESLKEYERKPRKSVWYGADIPDFDVHDARVEDFLMILEEQQPDLDLDEIEKKTNKYRDLRFSDYPEAYKVLDEMYKDYGFYAPDGQWIHKPVDNLPSARADAATEGSKSLGIKDNQSFSDFPDDAHKYKGAFLYNEPDGQPPKKVDAVAESRQSLSDFPDDVHKYKSPYLYNEPDGQAPIMKDIEQKYADYHYQSDAYERQFRNGMALGMRSALGYETGPYFPNEVSPLKAPFIDEPKPTQDELRLYGAYRYQEPDGHPPEKTDPLASILKEKDYLSESTLRKPVDMYRDRNAIRPSIEELQKYKKPFRYNEPDGKEPEKEDSVEKALKEYDSRHNSSPPSSESFSSKKTATLEPSLSRSPSKITAFDTANRDKAEDLDLLRTSDVRAASGIAKSKNKSKETDAEKEKRRKALEADFKKINVPGVEIQKPKVQKLKSTVDGNTKSMTGNFARDFPEEFSTTWSNVGSTLVPADARVNKIQEENDYAAGIANQDAYTRSGSNNSRIQTSLDRSRVNAATKIGNANADELRRLQAEIDPYSKEPQGLEISYAQEIAEQSEGDLSPFVSSYGCGNSTSKVVNGGNELSSKEKDPKLASEVKEIYEDVYGTIMPSHRQTGTSSTDQKEPLPTPVSTTLSGKPNLYKILAFEPSTQSVKVAETTSITPDTSNPLTPAEALMRLSNPVKFFPHFEPLRIEGYEIVAGSGDVLVFRKVREADVSKSSMKRNPRNPVDGMSPVKPATGNFASPTGFVNYDLPPPTSSPPSSENAAQPKFKSNIDVRREEPVFSGRRNWDENEYDGWKDGERRSGGRKRMGRGKRTVVGASMVGSACYAVGVVAEWFRTGGVDGNGTGGRF